MPFFGQMTTEIVANSIGKAFDMLWEHRAPEDCNGSTKQRDFERSWYHARSPRGAISGADKKKMILNCCQYHVPCRYSIVRGSTA